MVKVLLKSGQIREYSDRDARLLVLVKRGTIVDSDIQPKAVQAEAIERKEQAEKPKRTYNRKDLKAA
jgi:hypothetical protein